MKYRKLRNFKLLRIWEEHICLIPITTVLNLGGETTFPVIFLSFFCFFVKKKRTFTAETQGFSKPATAVRAHSKK